MLQLNKQNSAKVCIQKSTYQNINLESLLSPLGGIKNYVSKGEMVLLKINLLNATQPEKAVVTNPELVKKNCRACH